ncbi:MAG: DinB family protein [Chitinophagales bacterium]
MSTTQANLLADTYEMSYGLVRFYMSKLKEADPYKEWEVNGVKLNSVAWMAAHLCWSENFLLLIGTGGPSVNIEWLNHYRLGADGTFHQPEVDLKTFLDQRKTIHEAAMAHIRTISDEDLMKENLIGADFGTGNTIKVVIQHAIRHEATHAGHLGWLCKINASKTI